MRGVLMIMLAVILTFTAYSQTAKEYFDRGYALANRGDYRAAIEQYSWLTFV